MLLASGKLAPAFSLTDLSGAVRALSDLVESKPVILCFFKVNCPVCQFSTPYLERLYQSGANIVGICQNPDPETATQYMLRYGATFPVLLETPEYTVSNDYGISSVPTLYLISTDRLIISAEEAWDKAYIDRLVHHLQLPSPFFTNEQIPAFRPG